MTDDKRLEQIASAEALTIFMALRSYLPDDMQRAKWCIESIKRGVLRALRMDKDGQP